MSDAAKNPRRHKKKGDKYERELARYMSQHLFGCDDRIQRTPLSGGGSSMGGGGSADLNGTPALWVEAKRTERFELNKSLAQAEAGASARQSTDMPVVINRRNQMATGESVTVLRLDNFLKIYAGYLRSKGYQINGPGNSHDEAAIFGPMDEDDFSLFK